MTVILFHAESKLHGMRILHAYRQLMGLNSKYQLFNTTEWLEITIFPESVMTAHSLQSYHFHERSVSDAISENKHYCIHWIVRKIVYNAM